MSGKKKVIIINGKGGSGKDTVCDIVGKHYKTWTVSSITVVKEAARTLGWAGGKDPADRKFLADLKFLSTAYNDMPFKTLMAKYGMFKDYTSDEILFVHISEPEEIEKFRQAVMKDGGDVTTLLIRTDRTKEPYGNMADDGVDNYQYDHVFQNDFPIEELEDRFMEYFNREIYS